ncbi:EF-hand calcium-binding domain-containing protein 6 [Gadus morhua]|uniref:EF-hand domain-containing protein n=1 Tax=Gadus morhua TaxID=8049 RepID=A0A8C5CP62_GADMO|nr:EF-hand calcium-binding domain-containing protein 6 [Gadus morhua]
MRSHSARPLSHTHPDQGSPRPDLIGQDHCGPEPTGTEPTGGDLIGPDLTKPDRSSRRHGSPDLNGLAQSSLDLIGTYLDGPDPTGPDLPGPDLNGPEPSGPDFTGTHLTGLDHFRPDHSSPDHGSIDHGSPDLVGADLTGPGHGGPAPSAPQCPTWSPGGAGAPGLMEVVFRRVRERLERRGTTLAARIQAIAHPSLDGTLSQRDLRKILEDSWVVLEDGHFLHVTRLLGFRHGRLDQSTLLDRYQEFSAGAVKQNGDGRHGDEHNKPHSLTAEECLAYMRAKMADDRADGVAAFKMRTADGDGMVDAADLRDTIRSLGLVASELEFQRLLRLIGLQPGAKLPCAHLRQTLQKGGARGRSLGTMNVLDQIQEQLASDLRYKRAFMLQALRGPEEEDRDLVFKKSLRNQLFTYDLPLRPAEFEQLWLRFDPEGRGCVTLVDFLNKLGVKHDGKSSASVPPGSADEAGRGRDPDVLSEAAELLEAKLPLDTGHRKSAYQDFLSALQPQGVEEGRSPTETPQPAYRVETLHGLAPDRALSRLRELVRDSAPVLHKAFSTFDPGRRGRVSGAELRRVLESVCARLSDGQYRHMLGELGLNWEQQTVDWKLFLARLQSPCQLAAPETSSRPINEVLAQIQEAVSGHLFDVTKAMVALDQSGTNSLSREDFQRVCGRYVTLSPHQFACLWPELPLSASGRLRCGEFLRRFGAAHPGRVPACTSPAPGERAASTMSNARRPADTARVMPPRPQSAPEFPSRLWSPTGSSARGSPPDDRKWRRDIHTSPASCRDSSMQRGVSHLPVKYDITATGSAPHQELVRQFLLKLRPPGGNRAFQRNRLPPPTKTTGRPAVLTGQCVEVLLRVDRAVRLSWRSIRQAFATYDPDRTGRISTQDFRKVLQCFSVRLTEEDFFHLSSYFDAGALGTISYNDFLRAYLH